MKILDISKGGGQQPCVVIEKEAHKKSAELYPEEAGQDYEWTRVSFKTMSQILNMYDCFFDGYGNLCTKDGGHLAPSYFCYLGRTIDVYKDCGFGSSDTNWLKVRK